MHQMHESETQTKRHAQFVVVPGKARINELFEAATGQSMEIGVQWKIWIILDPSSYAFLCEYIRPCHHQVLNDAMLGLNPAPLFRQLLRPYDLTIKAVKKGWTLLEAVEVPAAAQTVSDKPGVTIVWT
jgi:hypothetical protein